MKKILTIIAICALCGCGKTFYTHVDGENDMIGIRLPVESDVQLDVMHHVNGTTMTVKDKSCIVHEYTVSNSNTYFGCIGICEQRTGKIKVYGTNIIEQASKTE